MSVNVRSLMDGAGILEDNFNDRGAGCSRETRTLSWNNEGNLVQRTASG
uniref:Uncharacterized protein n=2 Tax=Anguilla anguilla TaxID=7936 RepID=A0A0E9RYS4_ANGAN